MNVKMQLSVHALHTAEKRVPREKGNCDPVKEDAFVNVTAEI